MTLNSERVHIEIAKALDGAIQNLVEDYKGSSLTDLFLILDKDSAELSVYDDEENLLNQRIIDAWIGMKDDLVITCQLRDVIADFDMKNKFDVLDVYKPFSINLSDENFIVLEELLLIQEDSIIKIETDFLDRMDKEFDDFLDKLLKD